MTIKDKEGVIPYRVIGPPAYVCVFRREACPTTTADGGEAMSNLGHGKHGLFQRSITLSLVAQLTIVSASSFAGPTASTIPAVGALSVDSDPPGAAVYLDGR